MAGALGVARTVCPASGHPATIDRGCCGTLSRPFPPIAGPARHRGRATRERPSDPMRVRSRATSGWL